MTRSSGSSPGWAGGHLFEQLGDAVGPLDHRSVGNALEHDLAHVRIRSDLVAVEHLADLLQHGLRRASVVARPARHRSKLAQVGEVEERRVADDLVLVAADPDHWE